jgi:AraC-like DNA-binding protein
VNLALHRPGRDLAEVVELLWHCHSPAQAHAYERVLPDGSAALVINLKGDEFEVHDPRDPRRAERRSGTLLVGPSAEFQVIDTDRPTELMGVVFRPGGAHAFLPLPVDEVAGHQLDLATWWGARAAELRERLGAARSLARRFEILENALRAARRPAHRPHPVVAHALHAFGAAAAPSVATVVARTGYSARHFIALFRAEVGLTPKAFQRVRRFQLTVRSLCAGTAPDLAAIALGCGYYDQAHFSHDFRAFAGLTPTEYLARRHQHPNHVAFDQSGRDSAA